MEMVTEYISNSYCYLRLLKDKSINQLKRIYNRNTTDVKRIDKDGYYGGFFCDAYNLCRDPDHVIDKIYIGNGYNASNYKKYASNEFNIRNILNVSEDIKKYVVDGDNINYHQIRVMDTVEGSLKTHFVDIINKLDEFNKMDGNILIHCFMGSSRSAAVCILYLMVKHTMKLDTAIKFMKKKRDIMNLNEKFYYELKGLETELCKNNILQ